jgi:hypothetical protein
MAGGLPALSVSTASADTGTTSTTTAVLDGVAGPALLSPADIRTQAGGPEAAPLPYVVLTWTAVAKADHYVVEISPNEDWTNNTVALPGGGSTVATTYEVPMNLPYAAYFWHVRAIAADGSHSAWSADSAFYHLWTDRPTITQAPTDANPTFAWTPTKYASAYVLQIAPDPSFSPDTRKNCLVNHASYTPYDSVGSEDTTAGSCFTVGDLKGASNTSCSATYTPSGDTGTGFNGSVVVKNTGTTTTTSWTVTLTWPGNQQVTSWSSAAGSQSGTTATASDSGNGTLAPNGTTTFTFAATYTGTNGAPTLACTSSAGGASTTTWYWRVRALDVTSETTVTADTTPLLTTGCDSLNRNCGPWTYGSSFSFTDPGTSSLSTTAAPTGLAVNCPVNRCADTPTMTWNPVAGARTYRVQLALDSLGLNTQRAYIVTGNSFTARDSYFDNQAGLSYHWVVAACGDIKGAVCGSSSAQATFTKKSSPVTLLSPADGATLRSTFFTLSWSDFLTSGGAPTQEAKAYKVQISPTAEFDRTSVYTATVDHTQFTRADALFPDGRYYWRVQAVDDSNHPLTWSAASTFIKDSQPPVAKLREPLELAGYNYIDFSEGVTGVSSASVGLAVASSGAHVAGTVFVVDAKHAVFVPATPLTAGDSYVAWVTGAVQDIVGNGGIADPTVVPAPLVADSGGADIEENWATGSNAAASGDAYVVSSTSGDEITVPFVGDSFAVYGTRTRDGGYATVKIDGTSYGSVSFFATTRQWQRRVFAVSGLGTGFHHATVTVSGKAPASSAGKVVAIDGFRSAAGFIQENAAQVMQWWSKRRATDAYHGDYDMTSFALAGSTGAHPTGVAYVKGSSVSIIGCKGPDAGKLNVVLNGSLVGTIDLYQSYTSCGKRLYVHSLSGSRQSVKLVATGTHNSRSTGYRVSVDAIKVSQ